MLECGMNHLEAEFCSNVDALERNIKSGTIKSFKKINDYSETLIVFKARQKSCLEESSTNRFHDFGFCKTPYARGKNININFFIQKKLIFY